MGVGKGSRCADSHISLLQGTATLRICIRRGTELRVHTFWGLGCCSAPHSQRGRKVPLIGLSML